MWPILWVNVVFASFLLWSINTPPTCLYIFASYLTNKSTLGDELDLLKDEAVLTLLFVETVSGLDVLLGFFLEGVVFFDLFLDFVLESLEFHLGVHLSYYFVSIKLP